MPFLTMTLINKNSKLVVGFAIAVSLFALVLKIGDTKAQTSSSIGMPTSGSCAMLMTMPVPLGWTNLANIRTGFNILGRITFTGANSAIFSGAVVNPRYQSNNSPTVSPSDTVHLNNIPVSITAMTASTGFEGGYKMTFTLNNSFGTSIDLNAIPANNSKTILLQSSGGLEPASGVCQL